MNPGSTHFPAAGTMTAPFGIRTLAPNALITPFSMRGLRRIGTEIHAKGSGGC